MPDCLGNSISTTPVIHTLGAGNTDEKIVSVLFEDDFSSGDFSAGWGHGSEVSVVADVGRPFAARCIYNGDGTTGPHSLIVPNGNFGTDLDEVFIEYDMKWSTYVNCKCLKVHGIDQGNHKANTTLNPLPGGGVGIQFGDGSGVNNDTQQGFYSSTGFDVEGGNAYTRGFDGQYITPDNNPGTEILFDDTWQNFRARVKFGDNNDAITEYYVNRILKAAAVGYTNKHPDNSAIDRITFFDFAHTPYNGTGYVTNVKISTGGWVD